MPLACFAAIDKCFNALETCQGMSLRYDVIVSGNLIRPLSKKSCYYQGFFRRETASGFYPWGNVASPRKRVAEGLCGWRHGNCFQ